ncbi:LPS export ABC transporter periplasmic protein LptC [Vibrio sp. SCSIO 43136]|uniref:LPS export ABC transporter periplasmic protein LptC n=1 Tax=Vibrio sp. SCSIO 43136 TaxID=2819101 RepID=UPI002075444D|nr:LPS export ABC transporter periplasmic protein LptC [Vibrio sp. SCSIO 43136]USD64995.1 LPS export ABC transporter periplasmic protein LptC [Vibrio sp. SCSIO 43136]
MNMPRPIYLILLFASCWSLYYLYGYDNTQTMQVKPDTELPMFSGRNLVNTSYNQAGLRNFEIRSKYLDHYAKNGDTIFESLRLDVFREGQQVEWTISADRGVLDKEYKLHLTGKVTIKNLLPEAAFDTMNTESLVIQLENKDFYANQPVKLFGPQFTTTGNAMRGNFDRNDATLFEQVQGRYEIKAP